MGRRLDPTARRNALPSRARRLITESECIAGMHNSAGMLAYDQLPRELRDYLKTHSWDAEQALDLLKHGMTTQHILNSWRMFDAHRST